MAAQSTQPSREPNPAAEDRVQLTPGTLYDGVISSVYKDGVSCSVRLDQYGVILADCLMARAVTSALLGFNLEFIPPRGTKCKVAFGTPNVVVALLDSHPPDTDGSRACYSVTGTDKTSVINTKTFGGQGAFNNDAHAIPRDLLEGEFRIANTLGVALSMLTTMAKLSAGDQAKVEVFLLQDMVRIVSRTYRHFSAVGQEQIYDDGRLNSRLDATSYLHEALGLVNPKDPRVPVSENAVNTSKQDKVMETGRWRYSHYLGFMGDFIHLFVTDPVTTVAKIGSSSLRSGNAHLHVGSGGEVLLQSISEIALERVVRIPVPIEKKRPEDPKGVKKEDYDTEGVLDKQFLKLWKYDTADPSKMVFQLREYARWLSTYHSLARFNQQQDKDWHLPTEAECPTPSWAAHEDDKEKANKNQPLFRDTYACIRIMRDGSIVNLNGEGGAMCLAGRNGYMSVPANLFFEAGGDIRFTAGQNILFMARRSMELVAVAGGIKMKARTWLHTLCERGSIWLKSDAKDPQASGYTAPVADDNKMGDQVDPLPIVLEHAVLLEGTAGRAAVLGHGAVLASTGSPADDTDKTQDAVVKATRASVRNLAGKDCEIRAGRNLLSYATGAFILRAQKALWTLSSGLFDLKKQFTLRNGVLNLFSVKAALVSATKTITGPKLGAVPLPHDTSSTPLRQHYNHIFKLPDDLNERAKFEPDYTLDDADASLRDGYIAEPKTIPPAFKNAHPIWDFEDPDSYQWAAHPFYESLSQQRLRTDDPQDSNYETWAWASNAITGGQYNGSKQPQAGKGAKHLRHMAPSSKALHKPSTAAVASLAAQTDLTPAPITFKFLKK